MEVKIVLEDGGIMPKRATDGSAAYDLYCPCDFDVKVGRNIIPLNIRIQLPLGYGADIRARSGFTAKGFEAIDGVRMDADVKIGLLDSDYRNIVGVLVKSSEEFTIAKGTRIAQMSIQKHEVVSFVEVDKLDETERGEGGFGSTGTK